jgi:hypothetical protein
MKAETVIPDSLCYPSLSPGAALLVACDRGTAFLQALQAFKDDAVTAYFIANVSGDLRQPPTPQAREQL